MHSLKVALLIAKKEIQSILNNPASYVVVIIFTLLWEFLFFKQVFLAGEPSLRILYDTLPLLLLILVPAVTMSTIAKEKDDGTLELVLTHPVKEHEFILGKLFGSLFYVTASLMFSLPIAYSISRYGHLDFGVYAGQFLGSVLFALALISLGIFVSSLFTGQIAALIVTAVVGFLLVIVNSDFITASLPTTLIPLIEKLSLSSHFNSISRGVIDLRDIWYFLSFSFVFLSLTYLQLIKRKYGNATSKFRNYQGGVALLVGIAVMVAVLGNRYSFRYDLTEDKAYTLSNTTVTSLKSLNDVVNITLYASSKLPAQYQPILRDTKDLLADYKNVSNKINIQTVDPSVSQAEEQEALYQGIRTVQFNVIGQEEFQLKTGYLGIVVAYGGKTEVIPFIQGTGDLEYQLTSLIKKLTNNNKKIIGFLSGHTERDITKDYSLLNEELSKQYEVKTITLDKDKPVIDDNVSVLVIAGPATDLTEAEQAAVRAYMDKGKSLFLMVDTYNFDTAALSGQQSDITLGNFLSDFGVTVNKDVVFDTKLKENIRFGNSDVSYMLPYPFWIKAIAMDSSQITNKLGYVTMPWPSSISINDQNVSALGYAVDKILATSPSSDVRTGAVNINPDQDYSIKAGSSKVLAVALYPKDGAANKPRIILVGTSKFMGDGFMQNSPVNLGFGMNAISWLAQDQSLADIKLKSATPKVMYFNSNSDPTIIKYGNMIFAFLVPVAVWASMYFIRSSKKRKKYSL